MLCPSSPQTQALPSRLPAFFPGHLLPHLSAAPTAPAQRRGARRDTCEEQRREKDVRAQLVVPAGIPPLRRRRGARHRLRCAGCGRSPPRWAPRRCPRSRLKPRARGAERAGRRRETCRPRPAVSRHPTGGRRGCRLPHLCGEGEEQLETLRRPLEKIILLQL